MGSNFIVTEFKGKAAITSNCWRCRSQAVSQQLNGDFDEQIRVIYTVTSDYARQYAIRGFLQDDPVSEDVVAQPTFGMGPQRPPDFNVVHTRWLQPGIGDLGIASLIWNAKDGKLSLGGLEMNGIMGWNGGINTDRTPFDPIKPVGSWTTDAPVLNLPVVVKNHLGDNGVSVHQLSCEQLENPIMSAANLMASVGGQQAIDEFIPPAGTPGADGTRLPPATVEQIAPAVDGVRQMFYKAAGLAAPAATAVSNPTAGQRVAITNGPTDVTVDGSAQTPQAAPAPVAAAPTPVGAAPATRAPSGPPEPSAGQVQAAPTQTIRTAAKPSFDCTKASTGPERLICSDPDLAALDVKLMADYRDRSRTTTPVPPVRNARRRTSPSSGRGYEMSGTPAHRPPAWGRHTRSGSRTSRGCSTPNPGLAPSHHPRRDRVLSGLVASSRSRGPPRDDLGRARRGSTYEGNDPRLSAGNQGMISGEDGKRYGFKGTDFRGNVLTLKSGQGADFELSDSGAAIDIYVLQHPPVSAPKPATPAQPHGSGGDGTSYLRGTVLGYHPETGNGMISGDDGQRYSFRGTDFKGNVLSLENRTGRRF